MSLNVARRGTVPPFIVMDVMNAAAMRLAQGRDVLHLEVGQPSTAAPAGVIAAAHACLGNDRLGYTAALGTDALRQAIADHISRCYAVTVSPERIAVIPGSSAAFILAFLTAFETGDRVALPVPGYPAYRHILKALGVETVMMRMTAETRFQPTVAALESINTRLDGLIISSPSNPTGSMIPAEQLRAVAEYCENHGIRLISDEIYHGITYGEPAQTASAYSEQAIVINSFSKYFSMTGWRLGWMVLPENMVRAVECLSQNMFISAPTLSQHAAVAAFDCTADLEANVRRYARNRELLLEELPKAGFTDLAPADGAFYIYADISSMGSNAETICRAMLDETGVAATPGLDFDPERGNRYIRFSFAGSTDDMAEAARRLIAWRQGS